MWAKAQLNATNYRSRQRLKPSGYRKTTPAKGAKDNVKQVFFCAFAFF
jgi:hypothetical protein